MRQNLLFVLRSVHYTQMQCNQQAEFLNVKPGGKRNNRQAFEDLYTVYVMP